MTAKKSTEQLVETGVANKPLHFVASGSIYAEDEIGLRADLSVSNGEIF